MPRLPLAVRLAAFATAFAFVVIVFGAFVRLSNAGLSCPDWPTCYGKATWPEHAHEIASANDAFPERPVERHKAWREQVHRMIAGTLGLLVFGLALAVTWRRRAARTMVMGAAACAAVGVLLYMQGAVFLSSVLSGIAIALPLVAAWRLQGTPAQRVAVAAFAVLIVQAMLGMWTVTLLLKPIVVMGHLLGGLLLFALLGYVAFGHGDPARVAAERRRLVPLVVVAIVLLVVQIALGGWTSANYAALACGADFPRCAGRWWPATDFREAFVLWRGIGVDYEGGVLDGAARAAIQIAHRIGALVVLIGLAGLVAVAWRRGLRAFAIVIGGLLCVQVALGIANVLLLLPLPLATAHNGVAALLLLSLVALLARLRPSSQP
ncbi:COX15/CtaA family protein [Dokdonella sp.]|uniref:COX15/CtaA family protein n=1 Tax=Dokdonella sp. TaxID=2291710 RepID=UPI0031C78360|nr:COX15/CtaA family protein [Dokdonella sp.]